MPDRPTPARQRRRRGALDPGARLRDAERVEMRAAQCLAVLVGAALLLGAARAAAQDDAPPVLPAKRFELLDDVVVTATRLAERIGEVPAAVSVVDQHAIHAARETTSLAEPLDRVPGVLVQDAQNFAQDARLQIRGFGTRSAFGVREIKVLVDGLPETLPDGQTDLDDIDLGAIARIEVLRGPASQLYGNASGGVIQLFSEDGPDSPAAALRATGGSFGLAKVQLSGGASHAGARLYVQGSYFTLDGYRDHATAQKGIVNAKLAYDAGETTRLTLLVNGLDTPEADDPGGLTREQVRQNRRQARDLNLALDAGEHVQQGKIGLLADHTLSRGELHAYVYALSRDLDSRLPIAPQSGGGIVSLQRTSPGGGLRYTDRGPLLGLQQSLTIGFDAQSQDDHRRRFANQAGRRGALGLDQDEGVTGLGLYARESVKLAEDVELSGGARYDRVRFDVDVNSPAAGAGSSARTLDQWSPGGGIVYTPRTWASLYANVGTAFQVPTTTELANPDGPGFNPAVGPQTARSVEIGARAERAGRADGGLAAYAIDVQDELVPYESASGRVAYRNAGSSRRYGLELDARVRLWSDESTSLEWMGAVTLLDAKYRHYATADGYFGGNDEPGIPSYWIYQQLALRHAVGLFAAVEGFVVDGFYVDDANTARAPGYGLANLRAGWSGAAFGLTIEPFVGLNNLTNAAYDATVRLNALGGRFFEPAAGFNLYGGVVISARL